jgi:hypothetical protein
MVLSLLDGGAPVQQENSIVTWNNFPSLSPAGFMADFGFAGSRPVGGVLPTATH